MAPIPLLLLAAGLASEGESPVRFGEDVLPILSDLCFHCHGPDAAARKADLRLDQHEDLLFVVEPGEPAESELIARLNETSPKLRMPPASFGKSATPGQVALLQRWVEEGAVWEEHWAFEAPVKELPPTVEDEWIRDPLDAYVLEGLRKAGLRPLPDADAGTWLRRVSLDLTGLPPEPEVLSAFVSSCATAEDEAAVRAIEEAAVDRLLGGPRRAEHRTREWLDIARYADTNGYQNDFRRDQWPWRDWVIEAYRSNMPYDRFVEEQVAGDLLPDADLSSILATGFQRNHRTVTEAGSLDEEWRVENVADRAETTATAFLGLTVACARCHDHKYDPITQRDYYAFYGFFDQVDEQGVYEEVRGNVAPILRIPSPEQSAHIEELEASIPELEARLAALAVGQRERHGAWRSRPAPGNAPPAPAFSALGPLEAPLGAPLTGEPEGHVDLGPAVDFEQDRPFSASLWVFPESNGAVYSRMEDTDRYRGTDLVLLDDMRPAVHIIHDWPENAIKVVGAAPLEAGIWHHISVTYNGSRKAAGVKLWVNGAFAPVTVEADSLDGTVATEEPLRVGLRRFAGALRGRVHDLQFHGEALRPNVVQRIAMDRARLDDGEPFFAAAFDRATTALHHQRIQAIRERRRFEEEEVPSAMVLRDRDVPRETRVLDRGRYDRPVGDVLVPDVPQVFGGLDGDAPRNRLGLARWLTGDGQPLTARVAVNRAWAGFFGRGLVSTPEDFGLRGARPSYPRLLDALAADFVASGWDLAALERRIALSATYRQSSAAGPELLERDPHNDLLARGPRHRLGAEALRDQALFVSGLLVERVGGPSVKPYQPVGLWKELAGGAGQGAYQPSKGDDLFRRSLYTYRKRTVPHPTLTTFDAPGFELCVVRRERTNTPLQALALMNGPTYLEAARHLAERMIDGSQELRERLGAGFQRVLGRAATERELAILGAAYDRHLGAFEADRFKTIDLLGIGATAPLVDARTPEWAAMTMVASTLLNLDEAVTKR